MQGMGNDQRLDRSVLIGLMHIRRLIDDGGFLGGVSPREKRFQMVRA